MNYWILVSFLIQLLLGLGSTQDSNGAGSYVTLIDSVDIQSVENITGALVHGNYLLFYSRNMLTIIELGREPVIPRYKYILGFQCRKLVSGSSDDQLLFLSYETHCVRELLLSNRQNSTFSGQCDQSGFINGDALMARFNKPLDIHKADNFYYVADYNNECIRRVDETGYVTKLISVHAKPFSLTGNLLVAADKLIFRVSPLYNTYTTFATGVDVRRMSRCSADSIVLLTKDNHIEVLPLDNDISLHTAHIAESFTHLMCHADKTLAMKQIHQPITSNLQAQQLSTMHLYQVHTVDAISSRLYPTLTNSSSDVQNTSDSESQITDSPVIITSITTSTESPSQPSQSSPHQTTSAQPHAFPSNESTTPAAHAVASTSDWHPDFTPMALDNHAHGAFDHLPNDYGSNKSWGVIVSTVLAASTLFSILFALICVIRKRYRDLGDDEEVVWNVRVRLPENGNHSDQQLLSTPYRLTAEYKNGQTECLLQEFQNGDIYHPTDHRASNGQTRPIV